MSRIRFANPLLLSLVLISYIFPGCLAVFAQGSKPKTMPDDPEMEKAVASALLFAFDRSSPKLKARDYKGYTLGSTRKEAEAISPNVNNPDPVWEKGEDGSLRYFDNDKLISVGFPARGDIEIAIAKMKDTFGQPNKDAIEKFSSELRITYVGTQMIAVVNIGADQLWVTVYDREWLTARLRIDFEEKYRVMKWFAEGMKIAFKGDFDSKLYPAFPQATWRSLKPERAPALEAHASADLLKKHVQVGDDFSYSFAVFSSRILKEERFLSTGPEGFVRCQLNPSGLPSRFVEKSNEQKLDHKMACFDLGRDTSLTVSHLAHLGTRFLAEQFFPPRGDKISVITPGTGNQKRYSWITKDFLKVEVTEFGIVRVIKEP